MEARDEKNGRRVEHDAAGAGVALPNPRWELTGLSRAEIEVVLVIGDPLDREG